jgi:hypothetical protein
MIFALPRSGCGAGSLAKDPNCRPNPPGSQAIGGGADGWVDLDQCDPRIRPQSWRPRNGTTTSRGTRWGHVATTGVSVRAADTVLNSSDTIIPVKAAESTITAKSPVNGRTRTQKTQVFGDGVCSFLPDGFRHLSTYCANWPVTLCCAASGLSPLACAASTPCLQSPDGSGRAGLCRCGTK